MVYYSNSDLPRTVQKMPVEAQDVFRLAYNSALASKETVEGAKDAAFAAVNAGWQEKDGRWVRRPKLKLVKG